jgi:GNAT superfamily N-acetyltransferase
MLFRAALPQDIAAMHRVRLSVHENRLNNPSLITEESYADMLQNRGQGWVCELDGEVVGFAVVDLQEKNIWALFVHPGHEGRGIGKTLHDLMINWCFQNQVEHLWLTTAPGTRAEAFYTEAGWRRSGESASGEVIFELTPNEFINEG